MPSTKDNALNKAKKLINLLNSNGIEVFKAYIFGSVIHYDRKWPLARSNSLQSFV